MVSPPLLKSPQPSVTPVALPPGLRRARWKLPLLDWYILRQFISTFFYAIMLLAAVACVIDFSQKAEDFVEHKAPGREIFRYFKNFIPHIAALLYPLFVFIACIFFTAKIAGRSELIAAQATGTSFPRLMRPYFYGSVLLGLLALWANHMVVPAANKQRVAFEIRYIHNAQTHSRDHMHIRLSPELYVYVKSYNFPASTGYQFSAEKVRGTLLQEHTTAERIVYDSARKGWTLYDVRIRTYDGLKQSLQRVPEKKADYAFSPADLSENRDLMSAMTTPVLRREIGTLRTRGSELLNHHLVELHRRSAQPFAGLVLTVIGACLASRKVRGGSGLHLAVGVAISAVYLLALQFTTTLSIKAGFSPLLAAWIPNGLFSVLAGVLYWRRVR